ncbi:hypothetical protein BJV77DRAFT_1071151 [Russula vinacea]|nr:hypothetical protein BJV77DRAFT_1071151 [Russula vinacea]
MFEELEKSSSFIILWALQGRFTNNLDTNIKAFPNQPTKILGPFFSVRSRTAQLKVFGHPSLHLGNINTEGSPQMWYINFAAVLQLGSLLLEEVKFNIFDEEDADHMPTKWNIWLVLYQGNIVESCLALYHHHDKDRGDLFYTRKLQILLTLSRLWMSEDKKHHVLHDGLGGLVTFPESQRDLIKVFNS